MRFTFEYVADFCFFQGPSKKDKYLVLFPSTLLMLSVSNRLSAFIYEVVLSTLLHLLQLNCSKGKLPLSGLNVSRHEAETESSKCTFEISGKLHIQSLIASPGPLIETIVCVCPTRLEAQVVYILLGQ